MRSIQINGDRHDRHRIHAVMVFPENATFRHAYLHIRMARHGMPADSNVPEMSPWIAPRWAELEAAAEIAARQGILAGSFLALRARMALDGLAEPSNRKALQGIEGFYRGKQYGDGKPMRPSPRKVEGMDFAAMSSVAHLRAASEVVRAIYGKDEAKARMHNARGVKRFLRFAAYFQRYGLQSLTPRTNKRRVHPMLDANRLWYVPSNIQPIEASQLPAAKPEMRKLLDSYSHT